VATSTFRNTVTGASITYPYERVQTASALGTTRNLGSLNGQSCQVKFAKTFEDMPSASLPGAWTHEFQGDDQETLAGVFDGQSNTEARGDESEADPLIAPEEILPNDYPYDENMSGPGSPATVGPALFLMDAITNDPRCRFTRASVHSLATGNQSIRDTHDGGTGDVVNGTFWTQAGDTAVLGGPITRSTCQIRPGMSYIYWYGAGEADASSGTTSGLAAWIQTHIDYVTGTYLAGAYCRAIIIAVLAPTAHGGATQERQDRVILEQISLGNVNGSPPVFLARYTDAGRKPGDGIHQGTNEHERVAREVAEMLLSHPTALQ
jgi:hypothetical protein